MTGNVSTLTLTVTAAVALAACRFVTQAGAYPAAGAAAFGVTRSSAEAAGGAIESSVASWDASKGSTSTFCSVRTARTPTLPLLPIRGT